jgi:hypothetical protein
VFALLVIITLRLPLLASAASLLSHTANNPMAFLISKISLQAPSISVVALAGILTLALSTPIAQSVFISASLVKFSLVF